MSFSNTFIDGVRVWAEAILSDPTMFMLLSIGF